MQEMDYPVDWTFYLESMVSGSVISLAKNLFTSSTVSGLKIFWSGVFVLHFYC